MSQLDNIKVNRDIKKEYDTQGKINRVAGALSSQEDANETAQALRDQATTRKHALVIWSVGTQYRLMIGCAATCFIAVTVLLVLAMKWSNEELGIGLYLLLGAVAMASIGGVLAALRAHSIRREDARHSSTVQSAQIEEARKFIHIFGTVSWESGAMLLAVAGAIEGALTAFIIAPGLAPALPLIFMLGGTAMFALVFVLILRWISARFRGCWAAIRAKHWVRNAAKIDLSRFPDKAGEVDYLREQLGPLCDHNFAKPRVAEYLVAGSLLLLVPLLFALLIAYRYAYASGEGVAEFAIVVGVSTISAILATVGTLLSAMGHVLPEDARLKTALHRRFPTVEVFENWCALRERDIERWANDVARRINIALRQGEEDGDDRWRQRGLTVPRPFANHVSHADHQDPTPAYLQPLEEIS